jgi:hypothetical protein
LGGRRSEPAAKRLIAARSFRQVMLKMTRSSPVGRPGARSARYPKAQSPHRSRLTTSHSRRRSASAAATGDAPLQRLNEGPISSCSAAPNRRSPPAGPWLRPNFETIEPRRLCRYAFDSSIELFERKRLGRLLGLRRDFQSCPADYPDEPL